MKNIFYLLLLLTSCLSCTKENTADFRIIDAATKAGIPNATVELYESSGGTIAAAGANVFRERTTTNDFGEYDFDYEIKDATLFSISAGADRYWNSTLNSYRNHKTLELDPEGYVKVEVRKVDTTEYATIYINSTVSMSFSGLNIDTSFISKQRGNLLHQYVWFIYDNVGELSSNIRGEEFYVPPHDTTTFEIIF